MKKILIFWAVSFSYLLGLPVSASEGANIKHYNWSGIDVDLVLDERFPVYSLAVYFSDGALSDADGEKGVTDTMLATIELGTRRFNQKEISDHLEYFGANYSSYVNHEYSTYTVSGLVKDVVPTMKMICHLFRDATFPEEELKKIRERSRDSLANMVTSQGSLADWVFRELSLANTPYYYPVGGKLRDIPQFTHKNLINKLDYFNDKVKKRIYITGPKNVLIVQKVIEEDCAWKDNENLFVRKNIYPKMAPQVATRLVLVTVPKANQAQVRIGRFITKEEMLPLSVLEMSSEYLGGGFTSKLMHEVRVKRGLTYSVGAFASRQKDYGRAGISTSTKNDSVVELLQVIRETIKDIQEGKVGDEEVERTRGQIVGSYPFRFERSTQLLEQILYLNHIEVDPSTLFSFPDEVKKVGKKELIAAIGTLFNWDKAVIVVLGSKDLKKSLESIAPVEVIDYQKFL